MPSAEHLTLGVGVLRSLKLGGELGSVEASRRQLVSGQHGHVAGPSEHMAQGQ